MIIDYNKSYYKLTDKDDEEFGIKFRPGIHDSSLFDDEERGFSFTELENMFYSINKSVFIWEVKIPTDAVVTKYRQNLFSDKLIFVKRININIGTIHHFRKMGANINIDGSGWALINFIENHRPNIAEYLIKSNTCTKSYTFALKIAAAYNYVDVINLLLDKGVDIHSDNDSALIWAVLNGSLDAVKYLIENGIEANTQNNMALQKAALNGYLDIAKYLVEHGADYTYCDDLASRLAYQNMKIDVVNYFESLAETSVNIIHADVLNV